jgi:hypothetical protein
MIAIKLDPQLSDEGPRPKKWQIKAKSTWHHFGMKIYWFKLPLLPPPKKKKSLKRRAHDLKNQDGS